MNSLWKFAVLAVAATVLCGCSTMKDSNRFNDLPTQYWNTLATEPPNEGPVSPKQAVASPTNGRISHAKGMVLLSLLLCSIARAPA
jgi:hypothetical protein